MARSAPSISPRAAALAAPAGSWCARQLSRRKPWSSTPMPPSRTSTYELDPETAGLRRGPLRVGEHGRPTGGELLSPPTPATCTRRTPPLRTPTDAPTRPRPRDREGPRWTRFRPNRSPSSPRPYLSVSRHSVSSQEAAHGTDEGSEEPPARHSPSLSARSSEHATAGTRDGARSNQSHKARGATADLRAVRRPRGRGSTGGPGRVAAGRGRGSSRPARRAAPLRRTALACTG